MHNMWTTHISTRCEWMPSGSDTSKPLKWKFLGCRLASETKAESLRVEMSISYSPCGSLSVFLSLSTCLSVSPALSYAYTHACSSVCTTMWWNDSTGLTLSSECCYNHIVTAWWSHKTTVSPWNTISTLFLRTHSDTFNCCVTCSTPSGLCAHIHSHGFPLTLSFERNVKL